MKMINVILTVGVGVIIKTVAHQEFLKFIDK